MLDPEFVLDTAGRERMIDRFGPDAESWCDGLAGLVAACCQRWGLELDEALSGGTSRVFLGRQDGTRPVVLKLTPHQSIADSSPSSPSRQTRTGKARERPAGADLSLAIVSEPPALAGNLGLSRRIPGRGRVYVSRPLPVPARRPRTGADPLLSPESTDALVLESSGAGVCGGAKPRPPAASLVSPAAVPLRLV